MYLAYTQRQLASRGKGDLVSLGAPTIACSRESLVEEEAAPEEERMDLDAT